MLKIVEILKKHRVLLLLLLISSGIKLFSLFPEAVEKWYSNGFYIYSGRLQRWLFGWIPFSIGDLLYLIVIIYLIYIVFRLFKKIKLHYLYTMIKAFLMIYILFNVLWGLNYNRLTIQERYDLELVSLDSQKVCQFAQAMVNRLAATGDVNDAFGRPPRFDLDRAADVMKNQAGYKTASVKPSLFGILGNYLGYSGYYNPITGEAQVNTKTPYFTIPFTTTHEIAHQLGCAKESEANFVGFLAASKSEDPLLRYSAYLDGYLYAQAYIKRMAPSMEPYYHNQLPQWVLRDLDYLKQYWKKFQNPIDRLISILYGEFLKANEQPEGMLSYSGLVTWLVAYAEKEGWEKL